MDLAILIIVTLAFIWNIGSFYLISRWFAGIQPTTVNQEIKPDKPVEEESVVHMDDEWDEAALRSDKDN